MSAKLAIALRKAEPLWYPVSAFRKRRISYYRVKKKNAHYSFDCWRNQTRLARVFEKNDFLFFVIKWTITNVKNKPLFWSFQVMIIRWHSAMRFKNYALHVSSHLKSFPPLADEEKSKQLSHCSSKLTTLIYVWKKLSSSPTYVCTTNTNVNLQFY